MAGIGSRFVALLLDQLIQGVAVVMLWLIVVMLMSAMGRHGLESMTGKWFLAAAIGITFLLIWGYFALFEALWHGQTPGKRVLKLRVIKDSGRQITLFESLARNLLRFVDYMPSFYFAGVITMLCNKRNKRLGDLAAGTIVVHERAEAQPLLWTGSAARSAGMFAQAPTANSSEPWQAAIPATASLFPADAVARLSGGDLGVIEAFFARALDLPLETRAAMAYRILAEMAGKMGVSAPEGNPERALEGIALQLRGQGRRH